MFSLMYLQVSEKVATIRNSLKESVEDDKISYISGIQFVIEI